MERRYALCDHRGTDADVGNADHRSMLYDGRSLHPRLYHFWTICVAYIRVCIPSY